MPLPYRVKINGRRALNGERFGIDVFGTAEPEEPELRTFASPGIDAYEPDINIFDFARDLIDHLEEQAGTEGMALPDSLQITLGPDKLTAAL